MNTLIREQLAKLIPDLKIKHMPEREPDRYTKVHVGPNRQQRRRQQRAQRARVSKNV